MTARKKKVAKKKNDDVLAFGAWETHRGRVRVQLVDETSMFSERTISRDDALLFAMELIVASGGLSSAEIAKHFSK